MALLFVIIFSIYKLKVTAAEDNKKSVSLGKVLVTDTTEKEKNETGDVSKEENTSFYTIIKSKSFRGKEDISEVIEKETGVQIRQSGGAGTYSTVSLRGASGQQVMIFIDGVPLNKASGGWVNLSNISLSDVESIEIYRGITPLNFGISSFGGIINIKTRRSKEGLSGSATTGYGNFNTRKIGFFLNHKPGKLDYIINADYLSSDNDYKILMDPTPLFPDSGDENWEKRNNAGFYQLNLLTKLGCDFTKDLRVEISNQFFKKDQGIMEINNSDQNNASFKTVRNITYLKYIINNIGSYKFNTAGRFSYSCKNEEWDDRGNSVGLGEQHHRYITTVIGYNHFLELPTEYNIFTAVLDFTYEDFKAENLIVSSDIRFDPSSRSSFSAAIGDAIILFGEKLIINPAIRYQYIMNRLNPGVEELQGDYNGRSDSNHYIEPQIGLKYFPIKYVTVKTNLAKYYREPSFYEMFGDRGIYNGNSELTAESGINFDAGFEINYRFKNKILKQLNMSMTYFKSVIEDMIVIVYHSGGIGTAENISTAHIQGIEYSINTNFFKYIDVFCNYTWQDAKNKTRLQDIDGNKIPGRFEHSLLEGISIKNRWGKIYFNYVFEKGTYYDSPNNLKAADKEEYNLGLSLVKWGFILTFEAKNLDNSRYEDFAGYPQPGRSFYATLKYAFKL